MGKFGDFQIFTQLDTDFWVFTRKFKKITSVIRESFSVLAIAAAAFKFISNFVANYYYEKYLIELFFRLNLLKNNNSNGNKLDAIKITKENRIRENLDNAPEGIKKSDDNINRIKDAETTTESSYTLNWSDYLLSKLPFYDHTNSIYIMIISQINTLLSIETIMVNKQKN